MTRLRIVLFATLLALSQTALAQFIPERGRLFMGARFVELEQLGEKELREDPKAPSAKLMPLCMAYGKLKRYDKVFPCLDRLEENIKRGDTAALDLDEMRRNNPLLFGFAMLGSAAVGGPDGLKGTVVPWLHQQRAESYTELRDYDRAIESAKRAFDAIPTRWNEERGFRIAALTLLGVAHALAGKTTEARKYAEDLSALSTSYPYTGLTKDKVNGLAKTYLALGDYKKAYEAFRSDSNSFLGSALMGLSNVLGGAIAGMAGESLFTYQEIPNTFMRVKTAFEIGEVKEAKEGYDQLLAVRQLKDNGEIYWVVLYDRGRIAFQDGDMPGAIDYWKKAIEVIEQQRSTINTEASKIGFVGDKQAVYHRLIEALFAAQRLADAFDYLERSKSRALVDMLAGKRDFAAAGVDENKVRVLLAQAEQADLAARVQVAGDSAGAAGPAAGTAAPAAAESGLPSPFGGPAAASVPAAAPAPAAPPESSRRSLTIAPAAREIALAAPELASLVSVGSTPIAEIQAQLPEDEALIEYYYDDKNLYAFVLTRDGLQGAKLEVKGLEDEVRALRAALDTDQTDSWRAPSQALYSRLIRPLEGIAAKPKLVIVAHAALHYLPFAALHDGNAFLLERASLRFLPSASVVKYLRSSKSAKAAGILAFGNPDLGDPKFDLRFAQEEALAVTQTVPQSRALVRKDATESALREFSGSFSYLHFATHGEFNAESPLNSALLLAKDDRSDGLLTVGKLYSLRLDADLVTLSACETGLGKVASGDDVVGLTRGFLYAGAAAIVASLWKVDDRGTAVLMTRFYEGLRDGKTKREALRQAQLDTRAQLPHPYFWAAFQLTGNGI